MLHLGGDSVAGTATCYRPDGPGIEIPVGVEIFHTHPDWPWGPPDLLYKRYRVIPKGKATGRGVDLPAPN